MKTPKTKDGEAVLRVLNPRFLFFCAALACDAAFCMLRASTEGIDGWFWVGIAAFVCFSVFFALHARTTNGALAFCIALTLIVGVQYVSLNERIDRRNASQPTGTYETTTVTVDTPFLVYGGEAVCRVREVDYGLGTLSEATLTVTNAPSDMSAYEVGVVFRLSQATFESERIDPEIGKAQFEKDRYAYGITVPFEQALAEAERGGKFFDRVRYRIVNGVRTVFDDESSGIALALLLGDKTLLGEEQSDVFRTAGLAHTLAVSGLHVGFLIGLLEFFLSRLRRQRFLGVCMTVLFLGFYACLCGGAVSVMRAVIMGILSVGALAYGKRSDSLNNLSFAALALIVPDPTLIADLSFQMSFLSVFAILNLVRIFQKGLCKIRCPRKPAAAISVTLAASVGLMPISAAVFNTFNLYTVLINFVALPLVSVVFTLLFLTVPWILVGLPQALWIPFGPLKLFYWVAYGSSRLPGAAFPIFSIGIVDAIGFFSALILFGSYFLYRTKRGVAIGRIVALIVAVVLFAVPNLPAVYRGVSVGAVFGRYGQCAAIVISDRSVSVVGDCDDRTLARADAWLIENRIRSVDCIVLSGYSDENAAAVEEFCKRFGIVSVVAEVSDSPAPTLFSLPGTRFYLTDEALAIDGFSFRSDSDGDAIVIEASGKRVLFAKSGQGGVGYFDCIVSVKPWRADNFGVNLVAPEQGYGLHTVSSDGKPYGLA